MFRLRIRKNFHHIPQIIHFPYILRNIFGTFYIRHHTDDEYIVSPLFEPELLDFFRLKTDEGIFLDIGSHIGKYSVFITQTFPKSTVYAFEANTDTYKSLTINKCLNSGRGTIIPIHAGISNEETTLEFIENKGDTGISRFAVTDTNDLKSSSTLKEIRTTSIDGFLRRENIRGGDIELIKIDVEGHEYKVLLGMKNLLIENKNIQLIVEVTQNFLEIAEYMSVFGYTHKLIMPGYYIFYGLTTYAK